MHMASSHFSAHAGLVDNFSSACIKIGFTIPKEVLLTLLFIQSDCISFADEEPLAGYKEGASKLPHTPRNVLAPGRE
jgi:hypothetical protein